MTPLEERIGYKFRNSLLLAEALTHPSLGHETQQFHFDNQRLEFLGDAVLQLVITEKLYKEHHNKSEGKLTKMRARMVSREALFRYAEAIDLGSYLMMGKGEEANGGRRRPSALADAFESLIGAIYLDSDLATVRKAILQMSQDAFERVHEQSIEVNPKGTLQELLQAISPRSPNYFIVSESGPEHSKQFIAIVQWDGMELGRGEGGSKKQAETAAALDALQSKRWLHQDEAVDESGHAVL